MEGWSFCIGPLGVPTSPKHPKSKTEPSAPPMNLGFIVRVRTPVHWHRFTSISICELSFGKLSWECNTRTTSSPLQRAPPPHVCSPRICDSGLERTDFLRRRVCFTPRGCPRGCLRGDQHARVLVLTLRPDWAKFRFFPGHTGRKEVPLVTTLRASHTW